MPVIMDVGSLMSIKDNGAPLGGTPFVVQRLWRSALWVALGGGYFKTEAQRKLAEGCQMPGDTIPGNIAVSTVLEAVVSRYGSIITGISFVYVMQKSTIHLRYGWRKKV